MSEANHKLIGLIAGKGQFPIIFARAAKAKGYRVVAVAHHSETDPALEKEVEEITWVRVGQLGRLVRALKKGGARRAVMCGGLSKPRMFRDVRPDLTALKLLPRLRHLGDDSLLSALAGFLHDQGIEIIASQQIVPELLAPKGCYTSRRPSRAELEDGRVGWEVAGRLGEVDVGQCVVVKNRVVLAVEAIEGTDETIRRAGRLGGRGAVVVKRCKPVQDERFDIPAVGLETVRVMAEAGAACLIIEAGRTLVFDRQQMLEFANRHRMAIEAWEGPEDGASS